MRLIGIFGTSGMAREAGDIAWALELEPIYIAQNLAELESWDGPADIILESQVEEYSDLTCVIGIGDNTIRKNVAERFQDRIRFTNLIHPCATFGRGQQDIVAQRTGVIVAAGVRFTNGSDVGDFTVFNQNVTIAHDCIIESYVHVAPSANISGNVHLKGGCWVGAGAVINQGDNHKKLVVGERTVIGSGAVVLSDCDPNAVYAGVPAKRLK